MSGSVPAAAVKLESGRPPRVPATRSGSADYDRSKLRQAGSQAKKTKGTKIFGCRDAYRSIYCGQNEDKRTGGGGRRRHDGRKPALSRARGCSGTVLIERANSPGSTWHAAGQCPSITGSWPGEIHAYQQCAVSKLEALTGQPRELAPCGGLRLANNKGRARVAQIHACAIPRASAFAWTSSGSMKSNA